MAILDGLGRIFGRGPSVWDDRSRRLDRRVDRVAPWLFIGPQLLVDQYAELQRRGVTHIVDLREEASDDELALAALGFRWRRIPIPDRRAPTFDQLRSLIEWLDADADPNEDQAVYLHCQAGLGRTPAMAIALLMQHDLTLAEAHRIVLAARPEASPTTPQLEWLREVEAARGAGPSPD